MGNHLFEVNGMHVSRLEDVRLITGQGRYAADWDLPDQLYGCFLRSDRAHAKIVSLDIAAAKAHPDVVGVYTGEDAVAAGYVKPSTFLTFKGKDGQEGKIPDRPVLAHGRVRFVGDAVALIVASTALAAQDAAELIQVAYEDLPVVTEPEAALADGAPQLHDDIARNMPFEYEAGDRAATDAAFAKAAHVTKLKMESTRVVPNPMEPRACLVAYNAADDAFTVYTCVQGVNMMKRQLAGYTKLPEEKLTVIARDVGGGFGQRSTGYPETCAVMLAAKDTGRPVKWISTRTEGFLADTHGRANIIEGELALDGNGKFLGLRINWIADMGAYLTPAGPVSNLRNPTTCINGVYDIPAAYGYWRLALTNTAPLAAYRGAGRPDIAYAIERLVDDAAAELKIDPAELRRRNFIPTEAFPYKNVTGSTYDMADLHGVLEKALELGDYSGFAARRAESEKRGKLRGLGIATVIENTGGGMYPKDEIEIEVSPDGEVTAYSVAHSQGQGHETTFAMLIAKKLEIPVEKVKILQGVPDRQLVGNHTGGSRTMVGAGTVCHIAAEKLIQQASSLAAEQLNIEPSQVSYSGGHFKGPEAGMSISLAELARRKPLKAKGEGTFGTTYPNGCHIAEVEIDRETGVPEIVSYVSVDDCGVVVNHTIVEGQMHGALAQGAGQVFGEHAVYDRETGQLLTASFADYYMPRSNLLPDVRMAEHATGSKVNPLGIKGMGESGCTASLPTLVNAVMDALRPLGISHLDMPLTSSKLWTAMNASTAQH